MLLTKTILTSLIMIVGFLLIFQQSSGNTPIQQTKPIANQKPVEQEAKKEQERIEIEILLNQARLAPPEFTADVLIQLAKSNRISDTKRKGELLKEAFHKAAQVQQPCRRKALPNSVVDTRSGYLANAFLSNLDRLSLQCRAVEAMISINQPAARELFNEIPKVKLQPLTCEEALVYDVSNFYEAINRIAQNTFSPKEIKQGEAIRFIQKYIEEITSPSQVEPASRMLLSIKTSRQQLESLIHTLSLTLGRLEADDRSFSVPWVAGTDFVNPLIQLCKHQNVSADELLEAYRNYLIKFFNATRCGDSLTAQQKKLEIEVRTYFNTDLRFATYASRKQIPSIDEEDIKPAKLEGTARYIRHWTSTKAKNLLTRVQQLTFKSAGKKYSEEEKSESEWQWRLSQLTTDLNLWESQDEASEEDYFHQKSVLFFALIEIVPSGQTRDKMVSDFIAFLSSSTVQKNSPIEWFLHADRLIKLAQSREANAMLELLKNSNNAILNLYVELGRLVSPANKAAFTK